MIRTATALLALAAFACACALSDPTPALPAAPIPTEAPTATPEPTLSPTPTPVPIGVYVVPWLPSGLKAHLDETLAALPNDFFLVSDASGASVRVGYSIPAGLPVLGRQVFALAAAFPTVADEATWVEVEVSWKGASGAQHSPLHMTQSTYAALSARLGEAAPGAVEVLEADRIADALWADRDAWGIVPFDELDPRLKVLYVDGRSPLRRNLDLAAYPLVTDVVLSGDLNAAAKLQAAFGEAYTNRDESRMTILGMTGVTALTRDLATK